MNAIVSLVLSLAALAPSLQAASSPSQPVASPSPSTLAPSQAASAPSQAAAMLVPGASPIPEPSASPVPAAPPASPTASASAEPTPLPAESATPSTLPTSPAPASPTPAAATPDPYTYRFVPRQPDHPAAGVPQIFAVYLNDKTLHSLGPILIKVATTPDVVKVISRSNGREGSIPMVAPGDFETSSKLPKIPFIAAGMTTLLEFIAVNADGKSVSVKVPVKI